MFNTFEIYSKNDCIYCTKIKELITYRGCKYVEKNTSGGEYTKQEIQDRVGPEKKINVVPQIFFNGKYIGGYMEALEFIAFDKFTD